MERGVAAGQGRNLRAAPRAEEPRLGRRAPDLDAAARAIRLLLSALGLDPDAPELAGTPRTAARALIESLLTGYDASPEKIIGRGFPVSGSGSVVAARIPILFVCPHHMLPAEGLAHVAFLPDRRVPGLARLTKLVDALARRLVLQEDLTHEIVEALRTHLGVRAAVAVIDARHGCMAVDAFAHRNTVIRTRSASGPRALVRSLESEIDATLRSPWPTHASERSSNPPGSISRSRPPRSSAGAHKRPTGSHRRRPSRSGDSSPPPRSSD